MGMGNLKSVNQSNKLEWYWWVIIILIAIIAILLFVGSFGTIDVTSVKEKPKEKRSTKEEIIEKHKVLLQSLIQKRENVYRTRKAIYNIVYFIIRLLFVGVWVTGNLLLYFKFGVHDLGAIMNYNNALIIIFIAFVFLFWGKLSTLNDWIKFFEVKLELWIFQKYIHLPEIIENNKATLSRIQEGSSQAISLP
jgi:hypothetical protein